MKNYDHRVITLRPATDPGGNLERLLDNGYEIVNVTHTDDYVVYVLRREIA